MPEVPGKKYFSKISTLTGFRLDSLEKVYRLLAILRRMEDFPSESSKLALKGGTAIQGLEFGFRRLSVDIDFNFVGSIDLDVMKNMREDNRNFVLELGGNLGYDSKLTYKAHALDQFSLYFQNMHGSKDHVKIDINYLERLPVAKTSIRKMAHPFDDLGQINVHSYCPEELFAGKVRALIVRGTARDIFDAHLISTRRSEIDERLFHKMAVFYLSMQERDPRLVTADQILEISHQDFQRDLAPLMTKSHELAYDSIQTDAHLLAKSILMFEKDEQEFVSALLDEGKIEPDQLFRGEDVSSELKHHPSLLWRLRERERIIKG